jgi:hypothetical protein
MYLHRFLVVDFLLALCPLGLHCEWPQIWDIALGHVSATLQPHNFQIWLTIRARIVCHHNKSNWACPKTMWHVVQFPGCISTCVSIFFPTLTSIPVSSLPSLLHTFTCIMPLFLFSPSSPYDLVLDQSFPTTSTNQFCNSWPTYHQSSCLISLFFEQFSDMSVMPIWSENHTKTPQMNLIYAKSSKPFLAV